MEPEKKQNKSYILIIIALLVVVAGGIYWYFSPSVSNRETEYSNVVVFSPKPEEEIKSPFRVTGEARGTWFFEASFPILLVGDDGRIIAQGIAQAQKDWMTQDFVPFLADLEFDNPGVSRGKLVLKKDNPSGLPEHDASVEIPVNFSLETTTIQLFFGDINKDPETMECRKTYPVFRTVPKVSGIARTAIEELLRGVTTEESLNGIKTSIPKGVVLQSLSIEGGVARADFNLAIEAGGSCRVAAIRSQIANTLRQFPTVSEVVISVNGNSAEALQP